MKAVTPVETVSLNLIELKQLEAQCSNIHMLGYNTHATVRLNQDNRLRLGTKPQVGWKKDSCERT